MAETQEITIPGTNTKIPLWVLALVVVGAIWFLLRNQSGSNAPTDTSGLLAEEYNQRLQDLFNSTQQALNQGASGTNVLPQPIPSETPAGTPGSGVAGQHGTAHIPPQGAPPFPPGSQPAATPPPIPFGQPIPHIPPVGTPQPAPGSLPAATNPPSTMSAVLSHQAAVRFRERVASQAQSTRRASEIAAQYARTTEARQRGFTGINAETYAATTLARDSAELTDVTRNAIKPSTFLKARPSPTPTKKQAKKPSTFKKQTPVVTPTRRR